jgi:hypothetical protein
MIYTYGPNEKAVFEDGSDRILERIRNMIDEGICHTGCQSIGKAALLLAFGKTKFGLGEIVQEFADENNWLVEEIEGEEGVMFIERIV